MGQQQRSIALIGLSGAGKSTVARLLAAQLGWPWVDTDDLIVQRMGNPITSIFNHAGEDYFRSVETATLRSVIPETPAPPCVLATGGGIVLREENRALLCAHTYIVWLNAPTDTLLARLLAHEEQRPLLAGQDPAARLEALRAARQHLYETLADQIIATGGLTPAQVTAVILAGYRERERVP